jgi:outer membrane protein assembly factor BamE (lipoprotein component of BamABCDE complex)
MKNKTLSCLLLALCFFCGCADTRSFECVRKLKYGMTIEQIEKYMGTPVSYKYINDSTECVRYVYDTPNNGMDVYISVKYQSGVAVEITDTD